MRKSPYRRPVAPSHSEAQSDPDTVATAGPTSEAEPPNARVTANDLIRSEHFQQRIVAAREKRARTLAARNEFAQELAAPAEPAALAPRFTPLPEMAEAQAPDMTPAFDSADDSDAPAFVHVGYQQPLTPAAYVHHPAPTEATDFADTASPENRYSPDEPGLVGVGHLVLPGLTAAGGFALTAGQRLRSEASRLPALVTALTANWRMPSVDLAPFVGAASGAVASLRKRRHLAVPLGAAAAVALLAWGLLSFGGGQEPASLAEAPEAAPAAPETVLVKTAPTQPGDLLLTYAPQMPAPPMPVYGAIGVDNTGLVQLAGFNPAKSDAFGLPGPNGVPWPKIVLSELTGQTVRPVPRPAASAPDAKEEAIALAVNAALLVALGEADTPASPTPAPEVTDAATEAPQADAPLLASGQSGAQPDRPMVLHMQQGPDPEAMAATLTQVVDLVTPHVTTREVPFEIARSHVRVYHAKDEAAARGVAELLGIELRPMKLAGNLPPEGLIELWWHGASADVQLAALPKRRASKPVLLRVAEPSVAAAVPQRGPARAPNGAAWASAPEFAPQVSTEVITPVTRDIPVTIRQPLPTVATTDAAGQEPRGLGRIFKRLRVRKTAAEQPVDLADAS